MANPTTASEWQESKTNLVTQRNDNLAQYAALTREGRTLEFQSAYLTQQLPKVREPVERAELRAQLESVQTKLQQNNNKIEQNQAEQARLTFEIERANEKILLAGSGSANTNTATEPANNNPGSNTQAQPVAPLVTPSEKISIPSQLYTEVSPTDTGQILYDVIDTDQGEIVTSFNTQAEANEYMVSQVYAPRSIGPAPSELPVLQEVINPNDDPNLIIDEDIQLVQTQVVLNIEDTLDPGEEIVFDPPATGEVDTEAEFIFEPLQEPPVTTDGDEFTGIDEQIERQRQLEDGSLEFAGIDEQIANNENTLQEPPQLSDEEVNNYFDQLQQERIENDAPADIEENVFNPGTTFNAGEESVFDPTGNAGRGLSSALTNTQSQATQQDVSNFKQKEDWRVRLSLAPSASYLYKASNPGILKPLAATDGVVFPYTPTISVNYTAGYEPAEITHSNYKFFQYKSSSVDNVTISCEFTAQDTFEANYLLAVIHFFRSVTKMFYGQDQNPKPGTPPPLCYLSGLGSFQFDAHPLAVASFNYSLPNDVDYIRAGSTTSGAGVSKESNNTPLNSLSPRAASLQAGGLMPGGLQPGPQFASNYGTTEPTYVPTKMQITISCVPIISRNDISNSFSLRDYATGKLLRGTQRQGGGIW